MKLPLPSRIPILYLIISVLIAVGVVPLYFYATKVVDMNRETLQRNEKLLQNTVTSSRAQEIAQREKDILSALATSFALAGQSKPLKCAPCFRTTLKILTPLFVMRAC